MAQELLSFRQYAARRGVSHVAVNKAVSTQRLVESVVERMVAGKPRRYIDPAVADREWALNTDQRRRPNAPEQLEHPDVKAAAAKLAEAQAELEAKRAEQASGDQPAPRARGPKQQVVFGQDKAPEDAAKKESVEMGRQLRKAQTARTVVQVRLEQLRLEKLAGSMVDVAAVRLAATDLGHGLQTALFAIPDRLADLCAAEAKPEACRLLILGEIEAVLLEYWRSAYVQQLPETPAQQ